MKWVFAVLLLCNVGLFLWTYGQQPRSTPSTRLPVNVESMKLLSEMEMAGESESGSLPTVEQTPEPSLCLRIGPFFDVNVANGLGNRLTGLSLPFEVRTVKAREIRAYRVYLGPFTTPAAVQEQRAQLDENGVTDHYVKRESEQEQLVSLGLFTQLDGAEALISRLKAKNIPAQSRVEQRTLKSTYWLELRDSTVNRRFEDQLSAMKWGDERTRLSQFPCP